MPTERSRPGLEIGGRSFVRLRGARCFLDLMIFLILEIPFISRIPLSVGGSERSFALMSTMSSPSMTPARGCLSFRNITRCIVFPPSGGDPQFRGAGIGREAVAERAQLERGGIALTRELRVGADQRDGAQRVAIPAAHRACGRVQAGNHCLVRVGESRLSRPFELALQCIAIEPLSFRLERESFRSNAGGQESEQHAAEG